MANSMRCLQILKYHGERKIRRRGRPRVNIYRKGIGPSEDRTATNSATNATDATEIATNATELTEDEKLIIVAVKQNPGITQQALHN